MLLAIKRVLRAAHLAFCGRARQLEFSRVPSLRQWQSFRSYSSSLLQKLHCTLYYFTPPYSQSKPADVVSFFECRGMPSSLDLRAASFSLLTIC